MSSTKHQTKRACIKAAVAALIISTTCMSSLSFSATAKAQEQIPESSSTVVSTTVEVAVVAASAAAYGWVVNKSYDLGKEVGRWLAGSKTGFESQHLADPSADYLLD